MTSVVQTTVLMAPVLMAPVLMALRLACLADFQVSLSSYYSMRRV